ncbi:MAG: lysine--tRNA ligase [Gemmatimonadota bacterium]
MTEPRGREAAADAAEVGRCVGCGETETELRHGLCPDCWYASDERPKPVRDRHAKLRRLRELGVEPYAYSFDRSATLREALDSYVGTGEGPEVRVAGRILSFRDMGGSAFAHIGDRSGRLQVYFKRDRLPAEAVVVLDLLDLGDWVGARGPLFRTRTGEVTVRVEELTLLGKTLRPLPLGKEEITDSGERVVHSAFRDVESRYRQRYADLAVNPEVREIFQLRARVISALRAALDARGFLEVETPILQPVYGGAYARPFTTYHKTLDRTLYLRIADELYLKRLIVGGLERVYEIGKDFRNEGMDRTHHPEFTMLELYQAYADYREMMILAEELVTEALQAAERPSRIDYQGRAIDLSSPWRRLAFGDAMRELAGIAPSETETAELRRRVDELEQPGADGMSRTKLLDTLFSILVEPQLVDATIVYDHPIEMSPLAKPKRGDPRLAERFEVIVAGMEIVNAFSELNDPIDQWRRFAAQARDRAAGDEQAQTLDEDYIRALEYGLPPTGGLGLGIDRLVMLLVDRPAIREVLLYPILRGDEGGAGR